MKSLGTFLLIGSCIGALGCSGRVKEPDPDGAARSPIVNPTGSCSAPDSGAREGYHAPDPDSIWLPDCKSPLKREYFRVFARSTESAYVVPRTDGAPDLAIPCSQENHELAAIVAQYSLCQAASSTGAVERVNNMKPADALALTHYLHSRLEFKISGNSLAPFPMPSDILDACALHPEQNSAALTALCERERDRLKSGNMIGFTYEGPGAVELAARLNELYGITPKAVNAVCTPGADQTCNDNPAISSLHGRCNPDGTCTCVGFEKNPDTGRCL